MNLLFKELKENGEDFEFYPTTSEMFKVIYDNLKGDGSFLDIGCGNSGLKKNFQQFYKKEIENYNLHKEAKNIAYDIKKLKEDINTDLDTTTDEFKQKYITGKYSSYDGKIITKKDIYENNEEERLSARREKEEEVVKLNKRLTDLNLNVNDYKGEPFFLNKYYVIEKSKILINLLDRETILVGTDFLETNLIDKKTDYIFCNPPYSEYKEWTLKILKEFNSKAVFLIIPQRWKEQKEITNLIENRGIRADILYTGDFLDGERQARAKIDIIKFSYEENKNNDPFKDWFQEFFKVNIQEDKDWRQERQEQEQKNNDRMSFIENNIVLGKNISEILIELYNQEMNKLIQNYKNLSCLDAELLKELNIKLYSLCEALKLKIQNLKDKYWSELFDKLDKITSRLTKKSRKCLLDTLKEKMTIDFTEDNIYAVVLWVMKNANLYYNQQLIEVFLQLSNFESVKKYKSNQNTWKEENWRWHDDKVKHKNYTLDYRIVVPNQYDITLINDLIVIARNLNFNLIKDNRLVFLNKENKQDILFGYKLFKNNNLHIKFNKKFIKAINIEASRLLGWVKDWSEVKEEFNEELNEEDESYFKVNKNFNIENENVLKLLN